MDEVGRRPHDHELRGAWCEVDGVRLHYAVGGPDGRETALPLIHVHGFGISGRYLVPTATLLARNHRTFVPDLPGFGRSERAKDALDIRGLARALGAFMDAVGVSRAVLVGNSLGCVVILELASEHPERVAAAVFCSPAGGPRNQPLLRAIWQLLVDGLHEPLRMIRIAIADYLRFGIIQALRLFRDMTRYPTLERVAALHVPALAVLGSRDPLVDPDRVVAAAGPLAHVAVVEIEGAPHAVNFTHPEELAGVIDAFVRGANIADDPAAPGETVVLLDDRGE